MSLINFKRITSTLLLVSIIFSGLLLGVPKQVNAAVPIFEIGANLTQNTITAVQQTKATLDFWWKEYIQDLVTYLAKNVILWNMTTSVLNWIEGGFQYPSGAVGSFFPANAGAFFADLTKEATGVFLADLAGVNICDPVWRQRFSTGFEYQYISQPSLTSKVECTVAGVPAFIVDFNAGGWDTWVRMTGEPQNNPFGLYRIAEKELEGRMAARQERESSELSWGDGSLTEKICTDWAGSWCRRWESFTPGQAIVKELNKVLENPLSQLEAADELTEVFNTLFSQIINELLNGAVGGLGQAVYFP